LKHTPARKAGWTAGVKATPAKPAGRAPQVGATGAKPKAATTAGASGTSGGGSPPIRWLVLRGVAGALLGFLAGLVVATLAAVGSNQYAGPADMKWPCAIGMALIIGAGLGGPMGAVAGWHLALGRRMAALSLQAQQGVVVAAVMYAAVFAAGCVSYGYYIMLRFPMAH